MSAVVDTAPWHKQALFAPAYSGLRDFIVLGFGTPPTNMKTANGLLGGLGEVVQLADFLLSARDLDKRLRVIELYVKEVGHDIASSVQAVIAMLRNVRRGLVSGPGAVDKIKEAEDEIMSAYRTAETLGITVDPDYNTAEGNAEIFDGRTAVEEILDLCGSEAVERHLVFRTDFPENSVAVWGDRRGIQSALMQLVINAIKYSKGSSHITLRVENKYDYVEFQVTDKGMPVGEGEGPYLWDFGWRGQRAKELHVNGSGIGLYTVRKIVRAHGGYYGHSSPPNSPDVVRFYFGLPKRKPI